MMRQLPFAYKDRSEVKRRVIDGFMLADMKEWNEKYPQYPVYEAESVR